MNRDRHSPGDLRRGGRGRDSADVDVARTALRRAHGNALAAADNLLRDVAMPIDRAAAGGTEDGYTARCRRVAEAFRQGAWSAGASALLGSKLSQVPQPCNCWKKPLHNAPCNAPQRFLIWELGCQSVSRAAAAAWP